jgi:hypothetical protein
VFGVPPNEARAQTYGRAFLPKLSSQGHWVNSIGKIIVDCAGTGRLDPRAPRTPTAAHDTRAPRVARRPGLLGKSLEDGSSQRPVSPRHSPVRRATDARRAEPTGTRPRTLEK